MPVCPEVEYGLGIPREPMHLVGDPEKPRLVMISTGIDHTDGMMNWAEKKLAELEKEDLCGFIFKSKSPSSAIRGIKIISPSGDRMRRRTRHIRGSLHQTLFFDTRNR